jgi:PGAP1-like protein
MAQAIIIGIHGLYNKPPRTVLEGWWSEAIAEGLYRNHDIVLQVPFSLAYWADFRGAPPVAVEDEKEPYEKVAGTGPLQCYVAGGLDKARAVSQKWGGRALDKEKQLVGLGPHVELLLGVKLDDLEAYYSHEAIRKTMRSRLLLQLERYRSHRIMLIAHSMGSIIAYDVLRAFDKPQAIAHFVTMGSPLGLPLVVHKIRDEFREVESPKSVRRWTNLADPSDRVALDCNLADDYREANGVRVEDVLVRNGFVATGGKVNSHKSYGYLRAPETSALVREFLDS